MFWLRNNKLFFDYALLSGGMYEISTNVTAADTQSWLLSAVLVWGHFCGRACRGLCFVVVWSIN